MTSASDPTTPTAVPEQDIDDEVRAMLAARKGEWVHIAEQSGSVSYSWISQFMNGRIPGAKVDTLKKLRGWLRANPTLTPAPPAAPGGTSLGADSEPSA